MPDSSTILLVDDEDSVQKLLTYPLERDGFRVVSARDGEEALRLFTTEPIDLVVLDIMLPKLDGLEVCKRLRDDYITKPFSIREFRSRVRALLRRAGTAPRGSTTTKAITAGSLSLDPDRRSATLDGKALDLTYVEFELLWTLIAQPGKVFSRRALLQSIWGDSAYREPRTIDVHVRHLREKLERDPSEPELILTVRGAGYRLQEP